MNSTNEGEPQEPQPTPPDHTEEDAWVERARNAGSIWLGIALVGGGHVAACLVVTGIGALFGDPMVGAAWFLFLGVSQLAHVVPLAIWMNVRNQLRTLKGLWIGAGITALLSAACWGVGMANFTVV